MIEKLLSIPNVDVYLVLGILLFFGLLETVSGLFKYSKRSKDDWIQEAGSFFILSGLIKPGIVTAALLIGNSIFPSALNLAVYNFWIVLIVYLLIDDLLQYWYHRSAHEYPFLWKLHRSHHQAEEMGYFVSYRNAGLYYLMMPNIWWVGIITFLGGGKAVALGLILKQLIIVSSHSTVKWDQAFYRLPVLKPVIKILQRIIITPAFHHAHHGVSKLDGVSDPNGNYGNMFSMWDQLFGSAHFGESYPAAYGLQKQTNDDWRAAYFYPLVKSKVKSSELNASFEKSDTKTKDALTVELVKGEKYLWCQCGMSQSQPFCDGSHHGTKHKPVVFEGKKTGKHKLCNCKISKTVPYCDNSHLDI